MAGGGGGKSADGKKKARIEIIPLIDVIFFLLATFVLFTLSLNKLTSLPVQLPVAGVGGQVDQNDTTVTLQVSEEDNCYWNKELIGITEVPSRLQNYKQNTANPRVMLAGDINARFGNTIKILDEVKKVGITQVSIETRIRPTGK